MDLFTSCPTIPYLFSVSDVSEAIPLRAALGVEMNDIVMHVVCEVDYFVLWCHA